MVLEYQRTRSTRTLEAIVEKNTHYVRVIVSRVVNTAPTVLSLEDLVQVGLVALVNSAERFDPKAGADFRTWAFPRILGAARDAVRAASSTSRTRNVHFISEEEALDIEIEAPMDSIASALPTKVSDDLAEIIDQLPHRQRLIILFYMHGTQPAVLAHMLGISSSMVHRDKQAAMSTIADKLRETIKTHGLH